MRRPGALPRRARGFSLIELAVALVVVALVLGSILVPLTTQVAQRKTSDTQKALEEIKEALLGFATAYGRLPCPASAASNGVESFCTNAAGACGPEILVPPGPLPGHGRCFSPYDGFVPAATLGLAATDGQGYAIDAWSTRLRYAVTTANASAFTAANGMRATGMAALLPDLYVCASSTGITVNDCGGAANTLVGTAPAVIYSLGPNWATGGTSADEAANLNIDKVLVFHVRSDPGVASGEFDDIVTWLSANVLYSRMVSAGQLP